MIIFLCCLILSSIDIFSRPFLTLSENILCHSLSLCNSFNALFAAAVCNFNSSSVNLLRQLSAFSWSSSNLLCRSSVDKFFHHSFEALWADSTYSRCLASPSSSNESRYFILPALILAIILSYASLDIFFFPSRAFFLNSSHPSSVRFSFHLSRPALMVLTDAFFSSSVILE